jgi:hypothetical protein
LVQKQNLKMKLQTILLQVTIFALLIIKTASAQSTEGNTLDKASTTFDSSLSSSSLLSNDDDSNDNNDNGVVEQDEEEGQDDQVQDATTTLTPPAESTQQQQQQQQQQPKISSQGTPVYNSNLNQKMELQKYVEY